MPRDVTGMVAVVGNDACQVREFAPGYVVTSDGRVYSTLSNWRRLGVRELAQRPDSDGYPTVRIACKGKRVLVRVHRAVAIAFLPTPAPDTQVCHYDGDKTNNHATNLRWGTAQDNADDRVRHGTSAKGDQNGARKHPERRPRGERVGGSRLTARDVIDIRRRAEAGETISALAREYGVRRGTVQFAIKGETWRHVA